MKKSNVVFTSVLTGSVLLSVLHHDAVYRDQYASREECQADWGNQPSNCEPESASSGGGGGSSYSGSSGGGATRQRYFGPSYEEGARPYTARQHLVQTKQMIARSGFGSSGARYSGGG